MTRYPISRGRPRADFALAAALLAVPGLSCAGNDARKPVYPVRGQVFAARQPAAQAFVIFHPLHESDPQPTRPYARVRTDGSFALTTYQTGDGAPAGEYIVTIFWRPVLKDGREGPDKLQGRYSDPRTSKLRVQVRAAPNELRPFQLSL